MEYNKKEELFDKINGLLISNPTLKETWINMGVTEAYKRTHKFFNSELVPEVPQFVANWYEKHKNNFNFHVWDYVYMFDSKDESDFTRWLNDSSVDSFQTLVNMHQFGYKVEKVDLFRVKLANGGQYLYTETSGNTYFTCVSKSEYSKQKLKELGFEWVLDCPGIVLEEV